VAGVVVLGLDPGSQCTGYGVVREESGRAELLEAGCIRTKSGTDMALRLAAIHAGVAELVARFEPAEAAVESVFTAKNVSSAIKLGQARGAALAALGAAGISAASYAPTQVKQSLVGVGRAEKTQVAFMVARVLGQKDANWPLDASDALAVAVCHLNQRRLRRLAGMTT
jgi:crossover junction endodeoxyribonuclease RuvC